ncbi:MAG: UvrD-helicase domain-containing protein, partial [Alteromonadales bacterium]|nr:UvrD-helicase domain-containing protein [Alteromonadales bacterium]
GRTGYLLNSGQATHQNILLLAYGRKAANEMDERIKQKLNTDKISASTFHKLGLSIIERVEGGKANISPFAEDEKAKSKWVQSCFEQLISTDKQYRYLVLEYFSKYYYVEKSHFEFKSLGDYYQYLTDNDIRTLKGEQVKSFGELYIANWLFNHGIEYQYEANYAVDVKTAMRKQYQPDFYLPELNIYIEYYGIDENGDTAPYIDREDYHASMLWKSQTHQHNNTRCIELSYASHKSGSLLSSLEIALSSFAVEFQILPDEVMLANLKEKGRITLLAEVFAKLVGLVKAACLDEPSQTELIANSLDAKQTDKAFELLEPILTHYQAHLTSRDEIDFEDMIGKALAYIESGKFTSPWRYIMVDEFQDISEPRARLVKALRDNHKGCSLFAVGDDWQAIYRFSGADVSLTTQFNSYFGATTKTTLDKTFRFNNRIGDVATKFICKNPAQITKIVHSVKQVDKPAVSILRKSALASTAQNNELIDEIANGAVDDVLKAISDRVNKPVTVYLLARNWFQLPDKATVMKLNRQYALLNIETQSFHASKGKEADFVVIVGLKSGKHGFPSNKASPAIIEALLAKQESFEHAEERRLFYVALTRARQRIYLIADMIDSSDFVKQLIEDYDVELNEFAISVNQIFVDQIKCLICETGRLKPRKGRFGLFYSCSHFPRCDHKERGCVKCDSVMTKTKHSGFKSCLNPNCDQIVPTCNRCGAEMVLRKSQKGEFWGCRNFKGNEVMSCKNGIDKEKVQWPRLS